MSSIAPSRTVKLISPVAYKAPSHYHPIPCTCPLPLLSPAASLTPMWRIIEVELDFIKRMGLGDWEDFLLDSIYGISGRSTWVISIPAENELACLRRCIRSTFVFNSPDGCPSNRNRKIITTWWDTTLTDYIVDSLSDHHLHLVCGIFFLLLVRSSLPPNLYIFTCRTAGDIPGTVSIGEVEYVTTLRQVLLFAPFIVTALL
jgi:hypothetical protein